MRVFQLTMICAIFAFIQINPAFGLPLPPFRKLQGSLATIPSMEHPSEKEIQTRYRLPGSFSTPFSRSALKHKYEQLRPWLGAGIWGILLARRKNLWSTITNMVSSLIINATCAGILVRHLVGTSRLALVHMYIPNVETTTNTTSVETQSPLYGLNVPSAQFRFWVGYHLGKKVHEDEIRSRLYFVMRPKVWRGEILGLWNKGRLLQSPGIPIPAIEQGSREGLLHSGFGQYISILEDEMEDDREYSRLTAFLQDEYGPNITRLEATKWNAETDDQQLEIMQDFLDWFRSKFPYYYDACDYCGSSSRSVEETKHSFLGISCPNKEESLTGRAKHVEFFVCRQCGKVTRFPRFEAALAICENRRGRCGEYNLLLLRMLQSLGHTCRWVIDSTNDHIWSEVAWNAEATGNATKRRQWLPLDPCEAAVNKNLLYESWGRSQRWLYALCAPPFCLDDSQVPILEDVTNHYRSRPARFKWWGLKDEAASAILQDEIDALSHTAN